MPRTPEEIKKGLECCMDHDGTCEDCPYVDGECRAFEQLAGDALALIQQLQYDNAQQARCIENLTDKLNALNDELAELQAERDALMEQAKYAGVCDMCKHEHTPLNELPCKECSLSNRKFEWRGVQKEE